MRDNMNKLICRHASMHANTIHTPLLWRCGGRSRKSWCCAGCNCYAAVDGVLVMTSLPCFAAGPAIPAPSAGNGACTDLASDCGDICKSVQNDCTKSGGIGDFLR